MPLEFSVDDLYNKSACDVHDRRIRLALHLGVTDILGSQKFPFAVWAETTPYTSDLGWALCRFMGHLLHEFRAELIAAALYDAETGPPSTSCVISSVSKISPELDAWVRARCLEIAS